METYSVTFNGVTYTITVKTDWTAEDKINYGDFNRIETNTATVRAYLLAILYNIPAITTVTNREKTFIDYLNSINRIEGNLETIRTHFMTPVGYGGAKTWFVGKGFDFMDAYRLERNILQIFQLAQLTYQSLVYCGTINCGYVRGMPTVV